MNTPPKLTDEQIDKIYETEVWDARRSYARAIESAVNQQWLDMLAAAPGVDAIMALHDAAVERECEYREALRTDFGVRDAGMRSAEADQALRTAVEQALAARVLDGWQPIETAPKDGTVIDLWHVEFGRIPGWYWGLPDHCCGEWGSLCDSDWHSLEPGWVDEFNESHGASEDCTHWMPMPPAPNAAAPQPLMENKQ